MNGFKAYRYYVALKLHFTTDKFNVFENKGNIKGSYETFNARNDRHLFDKLARRFDTDQELIQFIVANFVYGNTNMIYNQEEAEEHLIEWKRVKESITKIFQDDLNSLELELQKNKYTIEQLFNCTNNDFPIIIKLYLGKRINPQTVSIITTLYDNAKLWKDDPNMGLILENELRILCKMNGFFKYDSNKLGKIFYEFYTNCYVDLYK
jgi:hypothetical protein